MDDKILSFYAKDMSTREIMATCKEMYDADVSAVIISGVTEGIIEQVTEWKYRSYGYQKMKVRSFGCVLTEL
jgi:putative transposase